MTDRRLVIAGWVLGVLIALPGCGAKDQTASEAQPAATGGETAQTSPNNALPAGIPRTPPQKAGQPEADPLHPRVVIETSLGNIVVKLDAQKANLTVQNFLTYVDAHHYDGTIFHQVFKDYVILGGGYTPELVEKPTSASVRNEADNGLRNKRGTIAMARPADVIDSARSQFFFNLSDNASLDHQDRSTAEGYGYCVFGQVVEGMDVVDRIGNVPVKDIENFEQIPVETVLIKSIRRAR
jgi:cyclophilin family peptidyl-prolyl cis-trans isomerase